MVVIATKLRVLDRYAIEDLDWKKLTGNYNIDFVEAFIDMQPSRADKLAVANVIIDSMKREQQQSLFAESITHRIAAISNYVEQGMFSPYEEIERLMKEDRCHVERIDGLIRELNEVRNIGDAHAENHLLESLVEEAQTLGREAAFYTEIMLRRIYKNEISQMEILRDYIARCQENIVNVQGTGNFIGRTINYGK